MVLEVNTLKNIKNYAKERGVSRETIYTWVKKGKIKIIRIDGAPFVVLPKSS